MGGLFIEPVSEFHRQCAERHKHNELVRVLPLAVSDTDEVLEISVGGPLSSLSKATIQRFAEMDWSSNYHQEQFEMVETRTLNSILEVENVEPGFDLLSIDVEGFEFRALSSFDLKKWQPRMVIVELHDNNPNYPHEWAEAEILSEKFRNAGYRIVYKDFTNTIFLAPNVRPLG